MTFEELQALAASKRATSKGNLRNMLGLADDEMAQEQAMINARISREKENKEYMQLQMMQEAAARVPTTQVGLLSRPPVTYTAEGIPMQTPPLSMPPSAPTQNNSTTIGGFPVDQSDILALADPARRAAILAEQGNQSRTMSLLGGPAAGTATPNKSTGPAMEGVRIGNNQGDANRSKEEQLGFMDKIFSNPMLQRLMERSLYSQPTFGGNFISEQASGERGLRSVEAQSAELAQKKAMENNKIQATLRAAELKAGKGVKPDSTLANISKEYFKANQGIDVATQIENLLPTGDVGGFAAVGENVLNAIMTSLGGNPDSSTSEKVLLFRGRLYETFSTGKEMSQGDKDIIEIIAPESGKWTVSNAKMKEALRSLKESYRNKSQFNKNYASQIYGRDISTLLNRDPKPTLNVSSVRPAK